MTSRSSPSSPASSPSTEAGAAAILPDRLPQPLATPAPPELAEQLAGADPALIAAAAHAHAHAPFLRSAMRLRPATLARIVADGPDAAFDAAMAHAAGDGPTGRRLREARHDVALAVALADIGGRWELEQVTEALSRFADLALDAAIRTAIAERTPDAEPRGFVALALGKHGSHELNYSSDLDLIFLFDRTTLPTRGREEPDEAAVRIGRRVIELMQGRDGDGYVARIDLRLRPSPEVTPIAIACGAAVQYYHSEALPWERAAFIRCRAAAGDVRMGEAFLDEIRPFVWRRSLDFQAIREVRDISLRIRDHFDARIAVGPGFDLKRGRGGIREIEFFAQTHQMIFGGRDPTLRAPATLDALDALVMAQRIDAADRDSLAPAYRYLRAAEHRAQMIEDAQTHSVPDGDEERENYARFSGYADWAAMHAALERVTATVAPIYDRVGDRPAVAAAEAALPEEVETIAAQWRAGERRCLRSPAARAAFAEVEPALTATFANAADPRAAAARFDRFIAQLPSGASFFALLAANPALVGLLGRLLTVTPMLADALARRPQLFDSLLDVGALTSLPTVDDMQREFSSRLQRAAGLEDRLEIVRQVTGEVRFQIGAQLLEGLADPLAAGRAYSDLADAGLEAIRQAVEADFATSHGRLPDGGLVVLAMGRFGGRMLTSRSDLDLVFLHSGNRDCESDGPKPLAAPLWFHRLAQRLTMGLTVPTASGALYEIDTRLRPSGTQGPLVPSVEAFERYQLGEAWTFEHMALMRGRVVSATPEDRAAVEAVIARVQQMPRDPAKLRADALGIRAEMDRHKPGSGWLDVKLAAGGLVDLEFIVHVLQLEHGVGLTPDLGAAVRALVDAGLLAEELAPAHDCMTRTLILTRLVLAETSGPLPEPTNPQAEFIARGVGQDDAGSLQRSLETAKATVRAAWAAHFGEPRRASDG